MTKKTQYIEENYTPQKIKFFKKLEEKYKKIMDKNLDTIPATPTFADLKNPQKRA